MTQNSLYVADPRTLEDGAPHVQPIHDLLAPLRAEGRVVPKPDPNDGGIHSRLLILLETPGPQAVKSDYISLDNNDWAARNLKATVVGADIDRKALLAWNAVPFWMGDITIRPAEREQMLDVLHITQAIIDRMDRLKVIVFCGDFARKCGVHLTLKPEIVPLCTSHPSARAFNKQYLREHMKRTFATAAYIMHN